MARIFLCYRREDSGGHTGRIYDYLSSRFGANSVFMDVEGIDAGENFVSVIEERISGCDTVVVVIGRRWTGTANGSGRTRIEDHGDYVRQEIETALRLGVELVPVLVDGARFPSKQEVPEAISELTFRNALEIDDKSFQPGVQRLITSLEKTTAKSRERRRLQPAP